jgi:ATP phosphoribosyltransferase regulatory subunit
MRISAGLPIGVAALLFESAEARRDLEGRLAAHLLDSGFREAILPVVDYLDPYEEMLDSVGRKELYRLVDRDGEVLVLRSDFTPMLARLIAPRLASLELPLKLFYRGDVLRYQQDHTGYRREFYQVGAELLGMPGEEGAWLALRHFLELLSIEQSPDLVVVLGFAGALDRLILDCANGQDPSAVAEAVIRRERGAVRAGGDALLQVVKHGLPDDPGVLGEEEAKRLERLQLLCREAAELFPAIELRIDLAEFADQTLAPELAHGADTRAYYDGLVFKAFAGRTAQPVGGGGRYDRLFHELGAPVTAVGFGVILDRLAGRAAGTPEESRA